MSSVKLLHQEKIIRAGGVGMILSPFANFIATVIGLNVPNWWMPLQTFRLLQTIPLLQLVLWGATFMVGGMMLQGRRSSWLSVIIFLGVFIVNNLMHLKADLASGWLQPISALLVNVGLFLLVYSQEFRQIQEAEKKAQAAPQPKKVTRPVDPPSIEMPIMSKAFKRPPKTVPADEMTASIGSSPLLGHEETSSVHVAMSGAEPWAHVVKVTRDEILMRCTGEVPARVETDPVEIVIAEGLVMRLRFVSKKESDYAFRFTNASESDLKRFGIWLEDQGGRTLPVRRSS